MTLFLVARVPPPPTPWRHGAVVMEITIARGGAGLS